MSPDHLARLLQPHAEWRPPLRPYHYANVDGGSTRRIFGKRLTAEDLLHSPRPDAARS